jgi:hypothetical protein
LPLLSRPTTEMFTCFFLTPKILARAEKKTDMVGVGGCGMVVVNRGLEGSVSLMIGSGCGTVVCQTVAIFVRDVVTKRGAM